ncbi:Syg1p CYBJADRAFT_193439, partial [Cyberlindnera jadinii NRRL Y-1542]
MKFAENLSENMVPEWRDKYLDYKGGKKLIKKIAQSPSFLAKSLLSTPGTSSAAAERLRAFTLTQNNRSTTPGSFELPPAAVDPTESLNNDDASNDRTPLLRATSNLEHTLSSTGSLTGEIHQRKSASNRASVPATYSGGSAELVEGISMDTMNDTSISEFTEWLDKQLAKIEGFYKEREDNM